MRRVMVLGALLLVGALSVVGVSGQRGGQMNVQVEQLEDNLYVLRGGGGNSAAFVTSNGVVLVDTKLAGWGQPLIDKIGELTSNPITTIINTHAHFDHVDGNVEFPASVEFVAHENTQRLMRENNDVRGFGTPARPSPFEGNNANGLPERTFTDTLTLGSGSDRVELHYFGRAQPTGHEVGDRRAPALRRADIRQETAHEVGVLAQPLPPSRARRRGRSLRPERGDQPPGLAGNRRSCPPRAIPGYPLRGRHPRRPALSARLSAPGRHAPGPKRPRPLQPRPARPGPRRGRCGS